MTKKNNAFPGMSSSIEQSLLKKIVSIRGLINQFTDVLKKEGDFLIAGCGDGMEAEIFSRFDNRRIVAVDIGIKNRTLNNIIFKSGDLHQLDFPKETFTFIYNYHVLEHVENPLAVLEELSRVLLKSGVLFIGFPNKNRIIGYIGIHKQSKRFYRIKANFRDYYLRIIGRFENRKGAHAGFTNREFLSLVKPVFSEVIPVRNQYMLLLYPKYKSIIKLLIKLKLSEFIFPSNYYICTNEGN